MNQTEKAILKISQSKEKLEEFLSKNTMDELYEFILKEDNTILRTEFEEFMIDALENCTQIPNALTEKDLANIAGGKSNFSKKLISTALSALTILPAAAPLAGAVEPANGSSAESSATSKKEVDKKKKSSIWSRLLKIAAIPSALGIAALGYCKLRNIADIEELEKRSEERTFLYIDHETYLDKLWSCSINNLRNEYLQSLLPKFNTAFLKNLIHEILVDYQDRFGSNPEFLSDVYKPERNLQEQQAFTDSIALELAQGSNLTQNQLVLKYLLSLLCELFAACNRNLPTVDFCKTNNVYYMNDYFGADFYKRLNTANDTLNRITNLQIDLTNCTPNMAFTVLLKNILEALPQQVQ